MKKLLVIFLLCAFPCLAQSDRQWALDSSTLSYHISHPLDEVDGVSHSALGKGVCHAGQCDFPDRCTSQILDSGDSNRDLHMIQVPPGSKVSDRQCASPTAGSGALILDNRL